MAKTYKEINDKIKNGNAVVITAEEMVKYVEENGPKVAAKEIDVVTTGTFGPMCSSGAFLNFGHSDPPIKFEHLWLNDVHAYHGNAAVDCYIGVTRMVDIRPFEYGGGHVIEDLVARKKIRLKGNSYTTDCYPLAEIDTEFTIDDLNQAILCNPRNAYQRYVCAVNSSDRTLYTYMGKLLPNFGNAHFAGAGALSPLSNDPNYETIGIGTRIFLGGGIGYVLGEGTQHNPKGRFGTLFLKGDLKQMTSEYLRGATYPEYGTSMFVGVGVPIPILNEDLALKTAVSNSEILTDIIDYGIPRRNRPNIRQISYEELFSGEIDINGKKVKCSSLSSQYHARKIANELKEWIEKGDFLLNPPAETLPTDSIYKPMRQSLELKFVKDLKRKAVTCYEDCEIKIVAERIINKNTNHIIITTHENKLRGIVTSFDITKAVAQDKHEIKEIITKKVITTTDNEPIDVAARKMKQHEISALPVIDEQNHVVGIITSEELM
ncbi:MAG: homocysteine biosynthesis protein [Candidatus Lokiarchaeota archaeon]|nr:homocysteine biosynthesis protein [Candidatus Lokiarchaeota archaeon]